jgi:VCBS repeat-containing protein
VANTAPVATGVDGATSTLEDGTIIGHLGATDADGNDLTFHSAGTLPEGVTIDADGTFYVQRLPSDDDLLPGETRTVTFSYQANDGSEDSNAQSVTFTFSGLPQGPDIRGGNHPQSLVGTNAGERIWGGNSGDTLCGLAGADTLDGGNGTDSLCGGDGRDYLIGGNGSDTLDAGAGNDRLDGGNSPDVLIGGTGDDTFTGGNSPDQFYLGANWGHDVITDFDPKNEHIHLTPSPTLGSWEDFLNLKADHHIYQDGANVMIDDTAGDTLVLLNVKLTSLKADDFIFG